MYFLRLDHISGGVLTFEARADEAVPVPRSRAFAGWVLGALLEAGHSGHKGPPEGDRLAGLLQQREIVPVLAVPEGLVAEVVSWAVDDEGTYVRDAGFGGPFSEPPSGRAAYRGRARLEVAAEVAALVSSRLGDVLVVPVGAEVEAAPVHIPDRPADLVLLLCRAGPIPFPRPGGWYAREVSGWVWGEGAPAPTRGGEVWVLCEVERRILSARTGEVRVRSGWVQRWGSFAELSAAIAADPRRPAPGVGVDGAVLEVGDGATAEVGRRGTATSGKDGRSVAGDHGKAVTGSGGTAIAGAFGTAEAGMKGTATAGDGGEATAGHLGTATAGADGRATVGKRGTATVGPKGRARAGVGGTVRIQRMDGSWVEGTIGQGLEADVYYRWEEPGSATLNSWEKPGWVKSR